MLSAEYLASKAELGDYSGIRKELIRYGTIEEDNSFSGESDGRQHHYRETKFSYQDHEFVVLMMNGQVTAVYLYDPLSNNF